MLGAACPIPPTRADLRSRDGAVWLAVDVSEANHARARYNMLL